ncbi:MAG: DUF1543 domain-containing protein [Flavisolibacter sp.]
MIILGCYPPGRNIEQHDIFFGIGTSVKDLINDIKAFWTDGGDKIHIDSWREVNRVDNYRIDVVSNDAENEKNNSKKLFFINLGGYKENDMEEYHYKILTVAENKGEAIKRSKETAFYKHTGFKGAESHIDDKYGIDIDNIYEITDILPKHLKTKYHIRIQDATNSSKDQLHIGYLKLSKL